MKTMRLGNTGLIVSGVGIGGIPLTRPSAAGTGRAGAGVFRR
jgi:aryl-alcohol dehydrogenase-like predicted oxidoreductase